MAGNGPGEEPSTAPQADRWYTLRLGSSCKDDRPSSKFCTLRSIHHKLKIWLPADEFKPASIDKGQPGSLHKSKENRITVEFHNNQPGKPKVTFEGTSEDCKENDGVLFFDGETFRLERVYRAVKRLRHVRQAGESVAAAAASSAALNPTTSVAVGVDSRSPPLGKMARSQPLTKSIAPSVPLEVERIDIGEPSSPASKPAGKSADKDMLSVLPNPSHASPDRKSDEQEENVDIDVDDDEAMQDRSHAAEQVLVDIFDVNLPGQNDTDDEIADVDISDDDRDKGHNATQDGRNAEEEQQTSSSSGSSGSGSSGSGSGSGSSSSDSDGSSDDDSASSGGDVDIDGEP
ncbi:hypothetical protein Taro_053258 [Colocasia esculenta]|uniref:Transcription elongation factor Eaf N-terminal domain-containing protein n=1 Tax=Colocasia esculenta TaxID=4460 RepID=A0A843XM29_COLES|nr:hypothetical protein [Colocasia esculenta]